MLTLFLAVQISDPLLLLILPASGIIGYILGLKILERREIKFFYENDTLYYKWPTPIIILWSGLFVIRLFLELLGSENIIVLSIVDLLLSFSTGLIVSASIITVRQAKQFLSENVHKLRGTNVAVGVARSRRSPARSSARERLAEVETCGVNTAFGVLDENIDQDKRP